MMCLYGTAVYERSALMATKKTMRVSSHMGGSGSEYNGRRLNAPLPPELRKKYAKKTAKKK